MGSAHILYSRRRWSTGQRVAAGSALLASVLLPWWLASPSPSSTQRQTAGAAAQAPLPLSSRPLDPQASALPVAAPLAPTPPAKPSPEASPAPYRYVGHWTEAHRTAVVLSSQGVSIVVRVPGPVDERFDAESIDDRQVVLHDRLLERRIALSLSGAPAKLAAPATRQAVPQPPRESDGKADGPVPSPAATVAPTMPASAEGDSEN
jgi:hypothetical protein